MTGVHRRLSHDPQPPRAVLAGAGLLRRELAVAVADLLDHRAVVERVLRGPLHPSAGVGDVQAVPQGRRAQRDFPALLGGVEVVADADDAGLVVDGVLDEGVLVPRVAVEPAEVLGDDQVPGPGGDLLLGLDDRHPVGPHAAGLLAEVLVVDGPLIHPPEEVLDESVRGVDVLEVLMGRRDPAHDQDPERAAGVLGGRAGRSCVASTTSMCSGDRRVGLPAADAAGCRMLKLKGRGRGPERRRGGGPSPARSRVARPAMTTGSRALWAARDRVVVASAAIS